MVKHLDKNLEATRPGVVPEVVPNLPKVASEPIAPNLIDIEICAEPERPIHIDLDLDQLEDDEE